jgi:putative long chain acyl-CoA synthase
LVNLSGTKEGCMGRPLPGGAPVKIAAYDLEHQGLVLRRDGFAQECGVDEVGMLLARVRPGEPTGTIPLRGVFSPDDAWLLTGDLFRRDADGDYWRVDGLADVIEAPDGPVFTTPIRDALSSLPAVDLAVVYGVPLNGEGHELAVAAVTLRQGRELAARDIRGALRGLGPERRPSVVHVVDEIPVTTWYRPMTSSLRGAGIPEPDEARQAWYLDASGEVYRPLTDAAHRRLAARAA